MNALKNLFQIPIVKFAVHLVLILGIATNIYNIYNWYKLNAAVSRSYGVLGELSQLNSDSKNEQGYYDSYLYREKYAKSSGFKNKNEYVLDTSLLETADSKQVSYTPISEEQNFSNPQRWVICFFGVSDKNILRSLDKNPQDFNFGPECKK